MAGSAGVPADPAIGVLRHEPRQARRCQHPLAMRGASGATSSKEATDCST
jgi:hypothetical protein